MFNTVRFGEQLSRLRRNADLTQSDLAERVNVTRQAISKYEIGDSFPDISVLVLIADALGVSTGELIAAGEPTIGEACILHELTEGHTPTASIEDVKNLAPLLKPSMVEALAERLAADGVNITRMVELSNFLSDGGARRLFSMSDLSDLTPELLGYLLPFMDYDSRCTILDGVLNGTMDWHLLFVLRVDRSLIEAAVMEGVLPDEVLRWDPTT